MKQYRLIFSVLLAITLAIIPFITAFAEDDPPETPILPEKIIFAQTSVTKNVGDEFAIPFTLVPENATEVVITWASSDAKVAVASPEGKITCLGAGKTVITATLANGFKASCSLDVLRVGAAGIKLKKTSMTLGINETQTLEVEFIPPNTTDKSLKWSTSNAKIVKVSKEGRVTGVKKGTATVTATAHNGKKAACVIKVKEIPVGGVKLSQTSFKGKAGDSFKLQALVSPSNATCKSVAWSSSNKNVATVSSKGIVKLNGPGSATITTTTGNKKKATCKVTSASRFSSAHYYQGDRKWKFSRGVRKTACVISSFAIMLTNADVHATPRTVYNANGSTSLRYDKVTKKFGIKMVKALADNSPYLRSFNGKETFIKNPARNYVAAVKEALTRNPEGVCVYFRRGCKAHMIVAVGFSGNNIYYSDPGRHQDKGWEVKFPCTWVQYKHKMSYKNLMYMLAVDPK